MLNLHVVTNEAMESQSQLASLSFVSSVESSSLIASEIDIPDEPNYPKTTIHIEVQLDVPNKNSYIQDRIPVGSII